MTARRPPAKRASNVAAAVVSAARNLLGMQIARKQRSRLPAIVTQLLLGIAGLALITFICFELRYSEVHFGLARTAFAYVILIALVSLLGSFVASVVLSIIAAACLDYFFAPPLFTFGAVTSDDIVRIAMFLTTSLLVTALTTRLTRRENEASDIKAKLEAAQQIAHFGWWERDFTTDNLSLSDEACRILGLQPVDLPAWHGRWLDLIHVEDRTRVIEAAAAALVLGGPRYDIEYKVVRPDGTVRAVHSHGDVTWDNSGRPLRQFGVVQDITELRQAEQELRASEARFRILVDHASDAFFLYNEDGDRSRCKSASLRKPGLQPRRTDRDDRVRLWSGSDTGASATHPGSSAEREDRQLRWSSSPEGWNTVSRRGAHAGALACRKNVCGFLGPRYHRAQVGGA